MAEQSKMTDIGEVTSLRAWLKDKPPEFGCALAARSALRVVPLWKEALHKEEAARRAEILLPVFRTLAAANFACAWHGRAVEILEVARGVARKSGKLVTAMSFREVYLGNVVTTDFRKNPRSELGTRTATLHKDGVKKLRANWIYKL